MNRHWGIGCSSVRWLTMLFVTLLCILTLPQAFCQEQMPVPREDTRAVYEQLSRDLAQIYPGVLCEHNVHVVIALDTSRSMQDSRMLERFYEIWSCLLYYFFKPGDRFTIVPYHNEIVPVPKGPWLDYPQLIPIASTSSKHGSAVTPTMQQKRVVVDEMMSYFRDPAYLQSSDDVGTLLYQGQAAALHTASFVSKEDQNRVVLVLVVGDQETSNPIGKDQGRTENAAETEVRTLIEQFSGGHESPDDLSRGVMIGRAYTIKPRSDTERKLYVFRAMESGYAGKRTTYVSRQVYIKSQARAGQVSERPDLGWLKPLAFLSMMLAVISLLLMRFHIDITASQRTRSLVLSVFQKAIVSANTSAKVEPSNEVWVPIDEKSDRRILFTVSGISPSGCMVRKREGRYMRKSGGQEIGGELMIPYGVRTDLQAGLDQWNATGISIQPRDWRIGKTWPIAFSGFFMVVALACLVASARPPDVPSVIVPAGKVVELCPKQ